MYLTAAEAAARLGVSRATLYAYVSRGLVRSQPTPGRRDRRYAVADIEALVQRKKARHDPTSTASQALGIRGLPVLESALSSIDAGVLRYRGHEVTALSGSARLEEVAELLWGHAFESRPASTIPAAVRRAIAGMPLIPAMHMWLATIGAHDGAALNLAPAAVARTGSTIAR
ncbi:MAG: citrate synthase, partial [Myxococcota bacterium]